MMFHHQAAKRAFDESSLNDVEEPVFAAHVKRPKTCGTSPLATIPEEGTEPEPNEFLMNTSCAPASVSLRAASPIVLEEIPSAELDPVISFPDEIEEPDQTKGDPRHSIDDDDEKTWEEEQPAHQRRRLGTNIHINFPDGLPHPIPQVVLDDSPSPSLPPPLGVMPPPPDPSERNGPIIEEIPYNPYALVPYSPPPVIWLPPSTPATGTAEAKNSSPRDLPQMLKEMPENDIILEDEAMEDDGMGVLPMLTPLEMSNPAVEGGDLMASQGDEMGGSDPIEHPLNEQVDMEQD